MSRRRSTLTKYQPLIVVTFARREGFVKLAPRTVLPEVTIPATVTRGHNVTTQIVDTSPRLEDRSHLVNEIRKAHVVAIVYAIDNPNSFDRIATYWLPTIRSLGVNVSSRITSSAGRVHMLTARGRPLGARHPRWQQD